MTHPALEVLDQALTQARTTAAQVAEVIASLEDRLTQARAELAIRTAHLTDLEAGYEAVAAIAIAIAKDAGQ